MVKNLIKGMVIGSTMLAMVGTAGAADIDINIYGASAQYLFWHDSADDYLSSIGAGNIQQAEDAAGKNGITRGTLGADTINIRYTSKASYDGIYACKAEPATNPNIEDACATTDPRTRTMATTVNWTTGVVTGLGCQTVTIGASDVDGNTFGQASKGDELGHRGGDYLDRNIPKIPTDGMTSYRPVIVPFGFFTNSDNPMTNLTRLQALMIFSGKIYTLDEFGLTDSRDIIACFRHAGSGTHATLDAAVMRGDQKMLSEEDGPYVWFNDGSSDEMKCVNERGGNTQASAVAFGYADADQVEKTGSGQSYPNTKALDYNGAAPTKANIAKGVYSFWSAQWLFECDPDDNITNPHVVALNAFASNPVNLPASKAAFWNASNEMSVSKANDFAMPSF